MREHEIPKRGSGKVRRLGIPALRDRIVQMATTLVLEPIWEAEFQPCSYGFRPNRRAQDAIEQVRFFINPPRCYEWAIEGDVEDCFGSIQQGLLLAELRNRVTDKRVLRLVRQFLAAGIMRHGSLTATPSGTPQGRSFHRCLRTSPSRYSTVASRTPGTPAHHTSASGGWPRANPAIE
jgi:RNA-directed DNA polymerase